MRKALNLILCAALAFTVCLSAALPSGRAVAAVAPENILPVNHDLSKRDIKVHTNDTMVGITIVDETTDLTVKVGPETDEDFRLENKKWNGIPTVIRAGNNIFIANYTGGKGEPDNDNYINIAASPDLGKTWVNPWMIITASPRGLVWPLFFYNASGELCMTYGDNKMTGTQLIKFINPDGPLSEVRYTKPIVTGPPMSISCKPTLLSDGRILAAYGAGDTVIVESPDGSGETLRDYAKITSTVDEQWRVYSEVSIVEKMDGRLWALRRLEYGMGIEQSFSSDGGKTWTRATKDLSSPLVTPGSRFYMSRLKSGALLFVTNMAGRGMDRREMTVWLSEDDGVTWPYSLKLDPTQTSYPDFYQDEDGTIWLVHDRDRYGEGGIRLHVFTEEDVKKGAFVSDKARQGVIITKKDAEYGDIISVNGAFEKTERYKVGTELKEITGKKPTTVTVTDDNGKNYEIKGRYRVSGFDKEKAGAYKAYFIPESDLPTKLKDGYEMFNFTVVLEKSGGCKSSVSGTAGAATVALFAAAFVINKKRKGREL